MTQHLLAAGVYGRYKGAGLKLLWLDQGVGIWSRSERIQRNIT